MIPGRIIARHVTIEIYQRTGLSVVYLQALAHCVLLVIVPLDEGLTGLVVDAVCLRRIVGHVINAP
jgi:hypothetical protein